MHDKQIKIGFESWPWISLMRKWGCAQTEIQAHFLKFQWKWIGDSKKNELINQAKTWRSNKGPKLYIVYSYDTNSIFIDFLGHRIHVWGLFTSIAKIAPPLLFLYFRVFSILVYWNVRTPFSGFLDIFIIERSDRPSSAILIPIFSFLCDNINHNYKHNKFFNLSY